MARMRVLVTGIDGYIGAVLGPKLLEQGFDVVGIDCGFYRDGWLYNDHRPRPLTFTKDVRQITPKDVEGFDAVVHLAELSNDPLGELNERTTYEINHLGSVTLARACKEAGVPRFVYTSSCSVYGAAEDGGERSEDRRPTRKPPMPGARCWSNGMSVRSPTPISRLCSCATPRHSAPARACGSILSSTISPGSLGRPKRSG